MKKLILSLTFLLLYILFPQSTFGQITSESLVGKWVLVDFNMIPKKTNGKLTNKEIETVRIMKEALAIKPKFMKFTLNDGGSTMIEPNPDNLNPTWEFSGSVLTFNYSGKKQQEKYEVHALPDGKIELKALKSKVALPVMTLEKDVETDINTFTFTKHPRNPNFSFAGKSLITEGELVAENSYSTGKSVYFAIQRAEHNDILLTYVSLNVMGEVEQVLFVYINEEDSKNLKFGDLTSDEVIDLSLNHGTFFSESIHQDVAEKTESRLYGTLISKFKTKEDLENFKKFLKRD